MNGIIIVDKPRGSSSHDMVSLMRRLTRIRRIGHTGTLDPMATGVLPLCIGCATKAADMLTLSDKCYRAEMILGRTTSTLDSEGEVLDEHEVNVTEEEIRKAVKSFEGEIEQVPPMYSAIKQNGKKLYELAREGIEVERKARRVTINSIDILEINGKRIVFEVSCSKGTYIRTLCDDIGKKLGTGAYMSALRRIKTGCFTIDEAYTVEELTELAENGRLEERLRNVDTLFSDYDEIHLNEKQTKSIMNGVRMSWRGKYEGEMLRLYDNNGRFICISQIEDGKLKLIKSFWS
ncbi:MAG: tRNA pseudouridine(55) synthase TruB [bacterium]|nr:tRNA pseudouridine(55) synthase TruB [bacterium]